MSERAVFGLEKCAIFDLDGTLSDCRHRLHYAHEKNWTAFHANLHLDPPVSSVVELARLIYSTWEWGIILTTGRPESVRMPTIKWLDDHDIFFDKLYMRPDGDFRKDAIIKREMLDAIRRDGYEPLLVIDDRQQVVDMWRENGLTCLQHAFKEGPRGEGRAMASPCLTLMVGPSGAGKSTWLKSDAARAYGIDPSDVISSDQIRQDLTGDFQDLSRDSEVFEALHNLVKTRLDCGLPVVVDATNIRRAARLAITSLTGNNSPIRYIVINRSLDKKHKTGGWRNELGFDLIAKHEQTFQAQLGDILNGDGLPNVYVLDLISDD